MENTRQASGGAQPLTWVLGQSGAKALRAQATPGPWQGSHGGQGPGDTCSLVRVGQAPGGHGAPGAAPGKGRTVSAEQSMSRA